MNVVILFNRHSCETLIYRADGNPPLSEVIKRAEELIGVLRSAAGGAGWQMGEVRYQSPEYVGFTRERRHERYEQARGIAVYTPEDRAKVRKPKVAL